MKKSVFSFRSATLVAALLTGFAITSCGEDDKKDLGTDIEDPNSGIDIDNVKDGSMSAAKQREKLNAAACDLADAIVPSDFKYFTGLSDQIAEYADRYEGEAVQTWFSDLIGSMTKQIGERTETGGYENEYWKEKGTYNYYYRSYTQMILLSNFKGHFSVKDGAWVRKDASDLQFEFVDQEDKNCTLTLATSGNKKKVHLGAEEEWNRDDDYYQSEGWYYYTSNYFIDSIDQYVEVPEKMTLTLKQGSKTMAEAVVNVDLSSMKGEDFDISKDKYIASGKLSIGQYVYETEKAAYDPTNNAGISSSLKKDGKTLMSGTIALDGNYQREEISAANVYFNLMNEVQIRGKVSDATKFAEYIERARDNSDNKSKFTTYVEMANELLNLGVYYDGKDVRQAKVVLEVFEDYYRDYYGSHTEYYCQPVIYFGDDTKYTDTEVFFESGFDKAIAKFEVLLDELARLN